jgi:hypothetical protein
MKWLFALLLMCSPVCADELDYFCIFSNAAAAQADPAVGIFWNSLSGFWDQSTTFPGVSVTTPAALVNGISPITGFWIVVARTADSPALDADAACVMKLDRDLAVGNGAFVLAATLTGMNRTSASFKPMPAGAQYPIPFGK